MADPQILSTLRRERDEIEATIAAKRGTIGSAGKRCGVRVWKP
jgi:hypothetical protein